MTDSPRKPEEALGTDRDEASLKGTLVSVMVLGGFLAITWLLVFVLFISRNG